MRTIRKNEKYHRLDKKSAEKEAPSLRMLLISICFIIYTLFFVIYLIIDNLFITNEGFDRNAIIVCSSFIIMSFSFYWVAKVHIRAYQRVFSETLGENGLKALPKWKRYIAFIRQAAGIHQDPPNRETHPKEYRSFIWKRRLARGIYGTFSIVTLSLMAYHWDGLTIERIETIGGLIIWAIALRKWL